MARYANGECLQPRCLDARLDAGLDAKLDAGSMRGSMQARCRLDAGSMPNEVPQTGRGVSQVVTVIKGSGAIYTLWELGIYT